MYKHKRTVAAIAATSLLAVFAAQANKGADYKPTHKHEHEKRFTLTGGATYLEPSQNQLDYVDVISTSATLNDSAVAHNMDSQFSWGYYLAFDYKISKHYDVQASWQQWNSTKSQNTSATGAVDGVTSFRTSNEQILDVAPGVTLNANSHEKLDTQVFDANLGQYHMIAESLKSRLFAGVRYAQVNSKVTNTYEGTALAITPVDTYDSKFNGVGPEAGMDAEYRIWRGLGVVGSVAGAFLIGNQKSDSDALFTDFRNAGIEDSVSSNDKTRMIPTLNGKLGLNWETGYNLYDWGFSIEGGYQVAYYFDVVDQIQFNAEGVTHNYSDVGIMGPYLNVSAMF